MKGRCVKIETPSLFWIIPETRFHFLNKMCSIITKWIKLNNGDFSTEEILSLKKGDLVAYCKDDKYQRGRVVDIIETNDQDTLFNILGIDSDDKLHLKSSELKKICPDAMDIPELTIKCFLTNVKPYKLEKSTKRMSDQNDEWNNLATILMAKWFETMDHKFNLKVNIVKTVEKFFYSNFKKQL